MKNSIKKILAVGAVAISFLSLSGAYELKLRDIPENEQTLEGDVKLACEAILCLSTGTRPSECSQSIRKFFSIWDKKPWKIPQKRFNFLALCPVATPDIDISGLENKGNGASREEMVDYMNVVAHGATKCSANYLNRTHYRLVPIEECTWNQPHESYDCRIVYVKQIINTLPNVCQRYVTHHFTDGKMLETLKYKHLYSDGGYDFGEWRDNLQDWDNSSKSDDDNSGK